MTHGPGRIHLVTPVLRWRRRIASTMCSRRATELRVCRSSVDTLVSDGWPVWPLRRPEDEADLSAAATVFGCELVFCQAEPGAVKAAGETVVGIGPELEPMARLYAHLTQRNAVVVSSFDEIRAWTTPASSSVSGTR